MGYLLPRSQSSRWQRFPRLVLIKFWWVQYHLLATLNCRRSCSPWWPVEPTSSRPGRLRGRSPEGRASSFSSPPTCSPVPEGEGRCCPQLVVGRPEGRKALDAFPRPAVALLPFPLNLLLFPSTPRGLSSLARRTGDSRAAPIPASTAQPHRAEPKPTKGSAPSSPHQPLLGVSVPHPRLTCTSHPSTSTHRPTG